MAVCTGHAAATVYPPRARARDSGRSRTRRPALALFALATAQAALTLDLRTRAAEAGMLTAIAARYVAGVMALTGAAMGCAIILGARQHYQCRTPRGGDRWMGGETAS